MNKNNEKTIELTLNFGQADATVDALDVYTSLCIGQIEEVAKMVRQGKIPMGGCPQNGERMVASGQVCDQIDELMRQAKTLLGYNRSGSNGIGHQHVSIESRRSYEIGKVLSKTLALERHKENQFRGVNYDGLIVRYTTDQEPVANVLKIN